MTGPLEPPPHAVSSRKTTADPSVWQRLWRDQRGAAAALVAISLPITLAIAGLGVDAGWWYTIKRQNQSGADAAALSAAYEVVAVLSAGGTPSVTNTLVPAATQAATQNGYGGGALSGVSPGAGCSYTDPGTSFVLYQYCDATFAGVLVVLRQSQNSWLANFGSLASLTIANRAVAEISQLPPGCLLALNGTASDAINLAGSPTIDAPNCTIVSDSNSSSAVHLQGAASITAGGVATVGDWSHTGNAYTLSLQNPAQVGANPVPDPYASTLTHANFLTDGLSTAPTCSSSTVGGVLTYSSTVTPGCVIAGGLDIKNSTVNLGPGTYWLEGNLTLDNGSGATLECTSCSNGGAGVTIILTAPSGGTVGTASIASNADLDLNAPDSGPFAGMVLIQDSNGLASYNISLPNPDTFSASANGTETLTGLVYFPDAAVTFQGTPAASGPQCLVLVANTVALQGNPTFATSGCSSLGLNNLPIVRSVTLVE
jgi:hypothetical protein